MHSARTTAQDAGSGNKGGKVSATLTSLANNTTLGLIYTPGWLQNLSVSIDYFHILVAREIATVTGGNPVVQSLCLASPGGSSPYCALIQRPISYNSTSPLNFPTLYFSQTTNFQRQWTEGVDFELDYRTLLEGWAAGIADARLLWTHTSMLKSVGLPGSVIRLPRSALPASRVA